MELTDKNLERCGWLFSRTLGIMVREHEQGGGRWDVEMDSYTNYEPNSDKGRWENDQKEFDAADNVADLIKSNAKLGGVRDWVHGDTVEFV